MKKRRIFWTEEEKQKLVDIVYNEYRKVKGTCFNWVKVLNRVQKECLPVDRRRKIVAQKNIAWLKTRVIEKTQAQSVVPVMPEKTLKSFSTEELMTEMIERLIMNPMKKANELMIAQMAGNMKQHQNVKQMKKKRIMIVGLLNGQIDTIKREFKNRYELDCIGKDVEKSNLKQKVLNADTIILMTKFISHSTQDIVLRTGRGRTIYCHGGITSLKDKLEKE